MCRIITASELEIKTNIELSALFREVSQEIVNSEAGSPEQRNGLANLDNISRAMRSRQFRPRAPHPKPRGF